MPSKHLSEKEVCWPCKFFNRQLWKSGREPVYHSYCQHHGAKMEEERDERGVFIGANTDIRPDFCPIRGDIKAEKEASEGQTDIRP